MDKKKLQHYLSKMPEELRSLILEGKKVEQEAFKNAPHFSEIISKGAVISYQNGDYLRGNKEPLLSVSYFGDLNHEFYMFDISGNNDLSPHEVKFIYRIFRKAKQKDILTKEFCQKIIEKFVLAADVKQPVGILEGIV